MDATARVPGAIYNGFTEIQGNFFLNCRLRCRFVQLSLTFHSSTLQWKTVPLRCGQVRILLLMTRQYVIPRITFVRRNAEHSTPLFQLEMPAGSVVVRDMRCWHRAMPNRSQTIRHMLALVYFRRFHHYPDAPKIFSSRVPEEIWNNMSEECQEIYRFHPHD